MRAATILREFGRHALDLALPARCFKCGEILEGAPGLCPLCWSRLHWLGEPCCTCCGRPFEFDQGPEARCPSCLAEPPPYERARAALAYDDESRDLILRFKHADRAEAAPILAAMMARSGSRLIDASDCLVPVPLHWTRLWCRRFNQAALLSRELARLTKKQSLTRILIRTRRTTSQGHMGRLARSRNVKGAFVVPPKRTTAILKRNVLLIDDVLTTGSTVEACSLALLEAGAAKVSVLTLAMVLH